jgi:hypothetical protein
MCEGPFEGRRSPFVMDLKGEKALFEIGQRRKVIRGEDLPLNDREVDLHLIEPTGVGRGVDEDCVGPLSAEAIGCPLAPMNGAVVHDPEDASRGLVGLLAHDFANKAFHRRNAILELATTEDLGAVDIPGSQVDPGAPAKVLVFHSRGTVRRSRQSGLFPAAGLNAGFFVGRDNKVVSAQRSAFPNAMVQIEDRAGLGGKIGITRKDPASMLPRSKGIATEPAPQRSSTDLCDEALRNHVLPDLLNGKAGQRKSEAVREFTGKRLNLDDETGGKSGLYARREVEPPGQACVREKTACATCSRSGEVYPGGRR